MTVAMLLGSPAIYPSSMHHMFNFNCGRFSAMAVVIRWSPRQNRRDGLISRSVDWDYFVVCL